MEEIVKAVFAAPIANLLIVAGLAFLGIAVVGNISGKIEPGKVGRLVSGVFGLILLATGLGMYMGTFAAPPTTPSVSPPTYTPTPTNTPTNTPTIIPTLPPPTNPPTIRPPNTLSNTPTRTSAPTNSSTRTNTPTNTPTSPVAREDCLPYNPANLRIANEGASGWLLSDGASRMLILDNEADAKDALALTEQHTAQCFIGRDNTRPNRRDYIVQYWTGNSGLATTIVKRDCLAYNPANLRTVNEGASGWLLTDGASRMLILDNQRDAQSALNLAKRNTKQCFIGRGNTRPNRSDYIVQYWE